MWCMAATLWPPHCPPACSSSLLAFCSARRAASTSAGTSRCAGSGYKDTAGDRTNIASNVNVASFIVFPLRANLGTQLSTKREGPVSVSSHWNRSQVSILHVGTASQAVPEEHACARKRKPGSGGEHLDPGGLFQGLCERERGRNRHPAGARNTGERITHPPVGAPAMGWAARFALIWNSDLAVCCDALELAEPRRFTAANLLTSFAARECRRSPS